jgi:hypothetical protein
MCVLIDAASKSALKRTRKRRDSSTIFQRMSRFILQPQPTESLRLTAVSKKRIVILPGMNFLRRTTLSIVASLVLLAVPVTARSQATSGEPNLHFGDTPARADAASLQKKATQAQARIHANKDDRDQMMMAVKTNEVPLAKQVLLRNGFTAEDLENAKITLRTGGGKGGEDEIEISATCCDPKEITIQRSLEYFTK